MTKTISINEIEEGMIIETEDGERVVVSDVWPDQGPGLGIVVKGRNVANAKDWERRFVDTEETVEQIHG